MSHIKVIFLLILLLFTLTVLGQREKAFCRAVENRDYKKMERVVKKMVRKNRKATLLDNGTGSMYRSCTPSLDAITAWLNKQVCTEACWDKCQDKLDMYPIPSTIGLKMVVENDTIEKCFVVYEVERMRLNFLGHCIFRSSPKLDYKAMIECPNFIDEQIKNCEE